MQSPLDVFVHLCSHQPPGFLFIHGNQSSERLRLYIWNPDNLHPELKTFPTCCHASWLGRVSLFNLHDAPVRCCSYFPCFTDEHTEAQGDDITSYTASNGWSQDLNPGCLAPECK